MHRDKVIMSTFSSTDNSLLSASLAPVHQTTINPPMPPTHIVHCPPGHYSNSLNIINRHDSLLSLLNAAYPCSTIPSTSQPDAIIHNSNHHKRSYLCLYPHCDRLFQSLGSLRFHISKNHIVDNHYILKSESTSSVPSPTTSILPLSQKRQPEPPKRRGRPPKNASVVPYSSIIDTGKKGTNSNGHKPPLLVPYRQINPPSTSDKSWITGQLLTFEPHRTTNHHF